MKRLAVLGVFAVAACSSEPPAPAPSPRPTAPAIDCAHVVGGVEAPDGGRVVLDAVVLPTARLQAEPGERGWLFAKTGLLVRAGVQVELAVDPSAAGDATIGWGSPGPEGTAVQVPGCAGAHAWIAFAGGYTVREPMCLPLIVRANGREERASVRVGANCPA